MQDKNLLDNFNEYLDLLIEQQHKAMEYSDNMTLMYRSQGSIATLRRLKLLREEVLGVKNEKSNTIVFFKDNGIGMTKKIKTKIFEKFYRESKGNIHNIKGHGLGLAFVKKIIELHAGFISVQSQIGKGSTFKITLNNVNKT